MAPHWNIQISIQKVDKYVASRPSRPGGAETKHDRDVTKVLDLAITADSEAEAFAKARKMLAASAPEPTEIDMDAIKRDLPPGPHRHSASCHGAIGELLCGFTKA